jgi:dihydroorotate dehydrogenase (fumarate)
VPTISLSNPTQAPLPRMWIALLRGRVRAALAATTGVEGPDDVAKYLLAGADVVMTALASALLRHGPQHAAVLLDGLRVWMARHGFQTVDQLRGMLAVPADTDAAEYERASYVSALRQANAAAYGPW